MEANMNHIALRFVIAVLAGVIGSLLFVLLSTEDDLRKSLRKFLVGILSSGVFTGIALRYANLDPSQMDVWIAGAAAVGFASWIMLGVVLKKLHAWAAAWSASPSPNPPSPPAPPANPVPPLPPAPPQSPPSPTAPQALAPEVKK